MLGLTGHAEDRLFERTAPHIPSEVRLSILKRLVPFAVGCKVSTASRVYNVGRQIGEPWSEHSNGDYLVAIIREGVVKTLMFRRSTQPHTPEAYNVNVVRDLL